MKEKEFFKVVTRDGMYYSDIGEVYHDTLEKTLSVRTDVGTRVFNFLEVKYYDAVSMDKVEEYVGRIGDADDPHDFG